MQIDSQIRKKVLKDQPGRCQVGENLPRLRNHIFDEVKRS
jgi:hypothetical protein